MFAGHEWAASSDLGHQGDANVKSRHQMVPSHFYSTGWRNFKIPYRPMLGSNRDIPTSQTLQSNYGEIADESNIPGSKDVESNLTVAQIAQISQAYLQGAGYRTNSLSNRTLALSGERFICNKCGKVYRQKESLVSHSKIHMNINYPCLDCGKVFPHPRYLQEHRRTMHGQYRRFHCKPCGLYFKDRSDLENHNMASHGQRPSDKMVQ